MSYHIYLVEEHKNLSDLFTFYLEHEGWQVSAFRSGIEAVRTTDHVIDLWMVDILIPGIDVFQFAQEIRNHSPNTPIIFISDHDPVLEEINSLSLDLVYCLPKPFLPRDLVYLIHQLLSTRSLHPPSKKPN